ncbi:hypothetical protein PHJA_002078300 [Phtheirospermum japonicum]|uniref:DUF4408 domain-containing protein n=1 Tax=Phtheirospermum japonicum TaxID=374723 RepID=A0A830CM69_9LAMI|nr:hypothetical protein PHJA_002078300 [Phtheirospermum japonicum]
MLEQSSSEMPSSSIWASMNSWFTPAVFFVLLNLMIGTIALTSTLAKKNQNQPKFAASVLQRIKSTNFLSYYNNRSQDPQNSSHYFFQETLQISQSQASNSIFEQNPHKSQTHFVFEHKDSNLDEFEQAQEEKVEDCETSEQSMDEVYSQLTGDHFSRTKSDTEPASGKTPAKLPAKMKKSASLKSAFGHFEEEKIVEARRPATVRERGNNAKVTDGDEGVDAKADDFIHKFKEQLKLQRLDSIIRYKDMIGRGSGGR